MKQIINKINPFRTLIVLTISVFFICIAIGFWTFISQRIHGKKKDARIALPVYSAKEFIEHQYYFLRVKRPGDVIPNNEIGEHFPSTLLMPTRNAWTLNWTLIPEIAATSKNLSSPAQLYFSNSPELIYADTLPQGKGMFCEGKIKKGRIRLFISHINTTNRPKNLFVALKNQGKRTALIRVVKKSEVKADGKEAIVTGIMALQAFENCRCGDISSLKPQAVHLFETNNGFLGDAVAIYEIVTSEPLKISTVITEQNIKLNEKLLSNILYLRPQPNLVRGIFTKPDCVIKAVYDMSSGKIKRLTFGGGHVSAGKKKWSGCSWLKGYDETFSAEKPLEVENKGNYGAYYHLSLSIKNTAVSKFKRLVLLLYAAGGEAAILLDGRPITINKRSEVIIFNREVKKNSLFRFSYSYTANSSAPVHLIAIPLAAPFRE